MPVESMNHPQQCLKQPAACSSRDPVQPNDAAESTCTYTQPVMKAVHLIQPEKDTPFLHAHVGVHCYHSRIRASPVKSLLARQGKIDPATRRPHDASVHRRLSSSRTHVTHNT